MKSNGILSYLLILFMILGVSSCSEGDLDERLIGTWESESGFMIIKKDRTMKMLGKVDRKVVQGPISTEGGLLFLLTPFTGETITFFEYEIIDFEHVRIDRALFNRRGGLRPKEGAVPLNEGSNFEGRTPSRLDTSKQTKK